MRPKSRYVCSSRKPHSSWLELQRAQGTQPVNHYFSSLFLSASLHFSSPVIRQVHTVIVKQKCSFLQGGTEATEALHILVFFFFWVQMPNHSSLFPNRMLQWGRKTLADKLTRAVDCSHASCVHEVKMQRAEVGIAAVGSVSLPRELRGAREEHTATAAARRSTRLVLAGEWVREQHLCTLPIFYSLPSLLI